CPLALHDALPISAVRPARGPGHAAAQPCGDLWRALHPVLARQDVRVRQAALAAGQHPGEPPDPHGDLRADPARRAAGRGRGRAPAHARQLRPRPAELPPAAAALGPLGAVRHAGGVPSDRRGRHGRRRGLLAGSARLPRRPGRGPLKRRRAAARERPPAERMTITTALLSGALGPQSSRHPLRWQACAGIIRRMTIATMRLLGALLSAGRDVVETSTRELAGSRNDRLELWRFGRHLVRRGLVERVDQGRGGRGCRTVWRILDLPGLRQLGNVYGVRTQSTEPDPKDVSGARAVEACRKSYRGAQWSIEKGELDTPEGCLAVWQRAVKAGLMP